MNQTFEVTQVGAAYRHYEKAIRCHGVIHPTNNRLKWYDITRSDQPIEQPIRDLGRDFLSRQTTSVGIPSAQELGFVVLHRCGEGFYFLMLCTWRENNELWKTVFFFEADRMEDFALFPQDEPHKGTFCVWEMAVVSHETQAWTTYLLSDRTDQDAGTYLATII
ncbi:MAG: hypothetical protein COC23_00220 [Hyphomicrobiales bacterium]|nr:MAG: hypothetical protein COC23_00220 [Hyphomicrobiales bacterium]